MTRVADALNRTGVYEPNGLNQYQKVDGQLFAYDATGNLTQDRASDGSKRLSIRVVDGAVAR